MPKIVWKPGTLLAPVPPALISCGTLEKPNVFTVAWTGIVNTNPAMTYISVRPQRYSYELISESGEFVINLTTAALVHAADLCGVRSGRDCDKFALCHLTPEASDQIEAPGIAESPLGLECRVVRRLPLGTHEMFLAEIVAVRVDPKLLDRDGKLHLASAELVAFAHGEYFALGERLGSFGYSVKKHPTTPRNGPKAPSKSAKPAQKGKPAYRKDAKPAYSKDAKPAYNKDAKPAYNKDAKPAYSKDAKPSSYKPAKPSYKPPKPRKGE